MVVAAKCSIYKFVDFTITRGILVSEARCFKFLLVVITRRHKETGSSHKGLGKMVR